MRSGHGDELECLGGVAGGAGPLLELRAVGGRAVGDVQAFVAAVAGGEGIAAVGLQRGQPLLVGAASSAPQLDEGAVASGGRAAGDVPCLAGGVASDDLVVAAAGGLELPLLVSAACVAGPLLHGGAVGSAAVGVVHAVAAVGVDDLVPRARADTAAGGRQRRDGRGVGNRGGVTRAVGGGDAVVVGRARAEAGTGVAGAGGGGYLGAVPGNRVGHGAGSAGGRTPVQRGRGGG